LVAVKHAAKEVKLAFERAKKSKRREFFLAVDGLVSCACFCMLFETDVAKDKQEFHSFVFGVSFMQSVLVERCDARRETTGTLAKVRNKCQTYHERDGGSLPRLVRSESLATD
jgi:hypothetical protein